MGRNCRFYTVLCCACECERTSEGLPGGCSSLLCFLSMQWLSLSDFAFRTHTWQNSFMKKSRRKISDVSTQARGRSIRREASVRVGTGCSELDDV